MEQKGVITGRHYPVYATDYSLTSSKCTMARINMFFY